MNPLLSLQQRAKARIAQWARVRNPAQPSRHQLQQRNLYILPTRFGVVYAVILLFMFLAAINYQNSMAFLLTFLLTSLGLISLWQTHQNLHGLEIRLKRAPRPQASGQTELQFEIINPERRNRYAVGLQYQQFAPAYSSPKGESSEDLAIALPSGSRGRYQLAPVIAFTRFPTGLFHAWSWLHYEAQILVHPKPLKLQELQLSWQLDGGSQGRETRDGDDFAGLRNHRKGESLKHISWKAFAQGRGLLSKNFHGHALPELWVDWDLTPASKNLEERLAILTRQLLDAERHEQQYGLRLPGVEIPLQTGASHLHRCLDALSEFRHPGTGNWLEGEPS